MLFKEPEVMRRTDIDLNQAALKLMGDALSVGFVARNGWDPTHNIVHAWILAEEAGLSVYRLENTDKWWSGVLYGNAGGDYDWVVGPVEAKKATRAITCAFLLVMEKEE